MLYKIKMIRQLIISASTTSRLRTPFDIKREFKNRSFRSFMRFLLRFLHEESEIIFGLYRSWTNRNILMSHNVVIGNNFKIGPYKMILFIPSGGRISIGDDVIINTPLELVTNTINYCDVEIIIGKGTRIGSNASIRAARGIIIGENCLIASGVTIIDSNAHPLDPEKRLKRNMIPDSEIRDVKIGNNVWIGERAIITPGVSIGDGSIVGANAVVLKSIPANSIAVGNPARVAGWLKDQNKNKPEAS